MPKWGLTSDQMDTEPWGLPAHLLRGAKTITNSVDGDVYLTELEQLVVDSPPLQRLRRIRQLGTSHLVYPDGSHFRFGHLLGATRVAQDLLDAVLDHQYRPKAVPDLFKEWADTLDTTELNRRLAEATVVARLGALLHDLCHVPFGHTVEDDLGLLIRHDANGARFDHFWEQLDDKVVSLISPDLKRELRRLIISKDDDAGLQPRSRYPFVEDLVGNTICADLLDYLPRDHHFLGLPIALGQRFLEFMYVTPTTFPDPELRERVVIQVVRENHERSDIISELLKFLRYRYEESERVLTHHAKLAADAMIGKLLAMWRDAMWVDEAASMLGALPDASRRDVDHLRRWIEHEADDSQLQTAVGLHPDRSGAAAAVVALINDRTESRLEDQMRIRGDDGLLEHIWTESQALEGDDSRRAAIATLSRSVLDRRLYKTLGVSAHDDQTRRRDAERIFRYWGNKDDRRRLEIQAASYIGLKEGWHLVIWIPHPDMKLKLADVLVGLSETEVVRLHDHSPGCQDIYDNHERLWAVSVFGHEDLRSDDLRRDVLLAWLREELRLPRWEKGPSTSKEQVIVEHFALEHNVTAKTQQRLLADVSGKSGAFDNLEDVRTRLLTVYRGLDESNAQP